MSDTNTCTDFLATPASPVCDDVVPRAPSMSPDAMTKREELERSISFEKDVVGAAMTVRDGYSWPGDLVYDKWEVYEPLAYQHTARMLRLTHGTKYEATLTAAISDWKKSEADEKNANTRVIAAVQEFKANKLTRYDVLPIITEYTSLVQKNEEMRQKLHDDLHGMEEDWLKPAALEASKAITIQALQKDHRDLHIRETLRRFSRSTHDDRDVTKPIEEVSVEVVEDDARQTKKAKTHAEYEQGFKDYFTGPAI